MTENEYIKVSNRVKISAALKLVRDCIESDDINDNGISEVEMKAIINLLRSAEVRLFDSYEISK